MSSFNQSLSKFADITDESQLPVRQSVTAQEATEEARGMVENLQKEYGMDEEEAKKHIVLQASKAAEDKGGRAEDVFNSYPDELKRFLIYTPEELRRNQDITKWGSILAPFLFTLGAGFVVAGALRGFAAAAPWLIKASGLAGAPKSAMQVTNFLSLAKAAAFPKVLLPGVLGTLATALAWAVSSGVNNWNDVFHWGKSTQQSLALELEKMRLKSTGGGGGTGSGSGGAAEPRKSVGKTSKYKIFLGTIAGGRVSEGVGFQPIIDDEITDAGDLMEDVMKNLKLFLSRMPVSMTWEAQVKLSPFDQFGVRRTGHWITLSLYYTSRWSKRMFIDEILLGPVDMARYPVLERESVTITQPLLSGVGIVAGQPQVIASGRIAQTDEEGNVVEILPATANVAPSATVSAVAGPPVAPSTAPASSPPVANIRPGFIPEIGFASKQIVYADVAGSALHLREAEGLNQKIIAAIPNNTPITINGFQGFADGMTWANVNVIVDGREKNGAVAVQFLKETLGGTSVPSAAVIPQAPSVPLAGENAPVITWPTFTAPQPTFGLSTPSTSPVIVPGVAQKDYKTNTPGTILRLRSNPSASAVVIAQLPDKTVVDYLERIEFADTFRWFYVDAGQKFGKGWVASEFLTAL